MSRDLNLWDYSLGADLRQHCLETVIGNSIQTKSGCFEYQGHIEKNGYGKITVAGKTHWAHRLVMQSIYCGAGKGFDVCHKCDNRRCVNPNHLFWGTRKQNMQDAVNKGRQAKGFMLPGAKLSEDDKKELLVLARNGVLYKDIASRFGISQGHAGDIALQNGIRRNGISK